MTAVPYHLLVERVTDLTTQLRAIAPLAESLARADQRAEDARSLLRDSERERREVERERDAALAEVARLSAAPDGDDLRTAYRRGYETGYQAGRAGRARREHPEQYVRGDPGRRMRT